jgi:thiamine-phosphate pyrophosphorylase
MTLPRLYPILDTELIARRGCPLEQAAEAMLQGGAAILQLRHKAHYSRRVFEQAERIAELCRRRGVLLIVDDRADIAKLLGAGLHLGQDDLPPRLARKILGPEAVIGFSTHNAQQLAAAANEPADYLALGPIFETSSKEKPDPVVGLERLRAWRPLASRPLVAIGGITRASALAVLEAGADSVAVISDLVPEPCTPEALRQRMEEWQQLVKTPAAA